MKYCCLIISALLFCCACSKKAGVAEASQDGGVQLRVIDGGNALLPKATAFRMSGDYADNVAVTLDADGSLAYYPAVTDVTSASAPLQIKEGWWLNRQGISPNSVFTKWTFEEYHAMKQQPSREEIMKSIIPGARVTDMVELPLSLSEAIADPGACAKYLP